MIKCPSCGQRGAIDPGSDAFDARGEWQGQPAFKCRQCGSGIVARKGILGLKATRIETSDWSELESAWSEVPGAAA